MKELISKMLICVTLLTIGLFTVFAYAGEWVQDGAKWKYLNDSGEFITATQKAIDGKWYMFDADGCLVTGLYEYDGKYYSFNDDGTPTEGSIEYGGKKYNISNKGEIKGIAEDAFYGYQDSLSALYIVGGGYDTAKTDLLTEGLKQAKEYFDTLPLSRKAFKTIFKLKSYNDEAIKYMLDTVDINWKEQALKCAKEFYDKSQLDRTEMNVILKSEEFADNEASYGTEMAFGNDSLSSGVGKVSKDILYRDYLDKMSLTIINQKISDLEEAKKAEDKAKLEAKKEAYDAAKLEATHGYTIKSKSKKTSQLSLVDDDAEGGKVKIKISLPVPKLDGPNAEEINNLINDRIFIEARDYLEYNYYDMISRAKQYSAISVELTGSADNSLSLTFNGDCMIVLTIDLNTMAFKSDAIKIK